MITLRDATPDENNRAMSEGAHTLIVDTNEDIERAADRAATAQELRDCIEAMIYCPQDEAELNTYSAEIREVATTLVPIIVRIANMQEQTDRAKADLIDATAAAVDYLDACAEIAFYAFVADTGGETGEASL